MTFFCSTVRIRLLSPVSFCQLFANEHFCFISLIFWTIIGITTVSLRPRKKCSRGVNSSQLQSKLSKISVYLDISKYTDILRRIVLQITLIKSGIVNAFILYEKPKRDFRIDLSIKSLYCLWRHIFANSIYYLFTSKR